MPKKKHATGYSDDEELIEARKNPNARIHYDQETEQYTVEYIEDHVEIIEKKDDTYDIIALFNELKNYSSENCLYLLDMCTAAEFVRFIRENPTLVSSKKTEGGNNEEWEKITGKTN